VCLRRIGCGKIPVKLQVEVRFLIRTIQTGHVVRIMTENSESNWSVEVFFDGACPLCRREIAMLRRWDRQGRIRFTDIAAADFDPCTLGRTQDELMAEIHGRLPDGSWIKGVEVFRRLYSAVGFGLLIAPTRLPGITQLLDWGYQKFARNRLKFTGRCQDGVCDLPEQQVTR
jgi:predicted DCC family thiol-disulfide oxidoreductase YuxK